MKSRIPNAYFLIITYADQAEKDSLRGSLIAKGARSEDFAIYSLPPDEMPQWYLAGDIAISLREPTIISKVSFPIKFAEYLASGLPVIANFGTGVSDEIIGRENVGVLYELGNKESRNTALMKIEQFWTKEMDVLRMTCRKVCEEYLSLDSAIERYAKVYWGFSDR